MPYYFLESEMRIKEELLLTMNLKLKYVIPLLRNGISFSVWLVVNNKLILLQCVWYIVAFRDSICSKMLNYEVHRVHAD